MKRRNSHGGERANAGRKAIYGEPTVRVRVPESIAPSVVTVLSEYRTAREIAQLGLEPVAQFPIEQFIQACETRISAGFPSPADDYVEDGIDLNKHLITNAPATYFYTLEPDADSMNLVGLFGGNRVLVDRSLTAVSGDIVLALIVGEGAVIKELEIRGSRIRLIPHSSNPIHKPRTILEGEELQIVGVVTWGLMQFKRGRGRGRGR